MKSLPPILTAVAILLLLLAAYVAAYIGMGESRTISSMHDDFINGERVWVHDPPALERRFPHSWQATIFQPLAAIESLVRGMNVTAVQHSD